MSAISSVTNNNKFIFAEQVHEGSNLKLPLFPEVVKEIEDYETMKIEPKHNNIGLSISSFVTVAFIVGTVAMWIFLAKSGLLSADNTFDWAPGVFALGIMGGCFFLPAVIVNGFVLKSSIEKYKNKKRKFEDLSKTMSSLEYAQMLQNSIEGKIKIQSEIKNSKESVEQKIDQLEKELNIYTPQPINNEKTKIIHSTETLEEIKESISEETTPIDTDSSQYNKFQNDLKRAQTNKKNLEHSSKLQEQIKTKKEELTNIKMQDEANKLILEHLLAIFNEKGCAQIILGSLENK